MNEGTWLGLAAIAVTGVLALLNKIVERRHSSDISDLKQKAEIQDLKLTATEEKLGDCQKQHAECKDQHQTTEQAVAEIRAELAALKK